MIMWYKKINYLDRVKHSIVKDKILNILAEKNLTIDSILWIHITILCDINRAYYDIMIRNQIPLRIFDDGSELHS